MQADFFQRQIERLRGVYSSSSMNEERTRVLWDRFKAVPDHVFESAVNYLIGEFTSQQLPAMSRFGEAVGMFRTNHNGNHQTQQSSWDCAPCSDFGFGWDGETIVACMSCERGRTISPAKLAKEQQNYNRGKEILARAKSRAKLSVFPDLPYDPSERLS